ncbi:hypothetical protein DM01DRAFT_197883 [Hesseltinella vesiculosa]|uniref:Uncharacterized protein n=1 Tax=Hesseltinella vesiculosa TaxID=101127 RepID=A0A1X2GAJ6_9FUNG|nr:hypothetical protein DM01DRAFT_197883 [Hesseltinella vesiculosa]
MHIHFPLAHLLLSIFGLLQIVNPRLKKKKKKTKKRVPREKEIVHSTHKKCRPGKQSDTQSEIVLF